MQCVMNAAKIVKCLSGQVVVSQYIAVNVLRKRAEETEETAIDRAGEPLGGVILVTEIQEGLCRAVQVIVVFHS